MDYIHKLSSDSKEILASFLQMWKKLEVILLSTLWVYLKGITETSELDFTPRQELRRERCHSHLFKGQIALIVHRLEITFLSLHWKTVTEDRIEPRPFEYCIVRLPFLLYFLYNSYLVNNMTFFFFFFCLYFWTHFMLQVHCSTRKSSIYL